MIKNKIGHILLASVLFYSFSLFRKDHSEYLPRHFPKPVYDFSKNPLDSVTIELGRMLFYDPILSKNNTISCASCHSPFNAFAHTDHDLSHGIYDSVGTRNAPAIFNVAWQKQFMWDGAINHLDAQPLAPITHPAEMASDLSEVISKLKNSEKYPSLFCSTFKDSVISTSRMLKALSQFQLTLVSANAKYDQVIQGIQKFSPQEENGYLLYKINCASCHAEPLFSNFTFQNNGLPVDKALNDYGRMKITLNPKDSLKFKVPSLRNLSYTYPYMHDGRFKTLSEVLRHYAAGLSYHAPATHDIKKEIKLSSNEKVDLIAFLLTLNDPDFVLNKQHHFKK